MAAAAVGESQQSLTALPGIAITDGKIRQQILSRICSLCGTSTLSFPGSQPVSFKRDSVELLQRQEYVVCEKTDGIRALLFAASGRVFLIGRKDEIHQLNIKIPVRGNATELQQLTLLDGEVVFDSLSIDGGDVIRPRFLCFDGICIQRENVRHLNLLERLVAVYTDVILPIYRKEKTLYNPQDPQNTLDIYLKDFFDLDHIQDIESLASILPHVSDGLIFTPVRPPYTSGTFKQLLKWKPPHLNTVDFSVDVLYDGKNCPRLMELYVLDCGTRVKYRDFLAPYGGVYKQLLNMALHEKLSQTIVECSWIKDERVWTFLPNNLHAGGAGLNNNTNGANSVSTLSDGTHPYAYDFDNGIWVIGGWYAERIRLDKSTPNNIKVVNDVKESIEDDVTFEMLASELIESKRTSSVNLCKRLRLPKVYYEC